VIVDATCRRLEDRRALRTGDPLAGSAIHVECLAPGSVLAARARDRDPGRAHGSDAGPGEVARLSHEWDPLDEVPAGRHVAVRSDRAVEEVADDVAAMLDRRLEARS
jgi:hypothetical protein